VIGLFSDSHGDLAAFDAAYELLKKKGARRFFFMGGRYSDLDEWLLVRKEKARGGRGYSDQDFLADITNFLSHQEQVSRPPAWGGAAEEDNIDRLKDRFVRTPEKDCLQYMDASIDKKRVDMLGDALCCLVHDKNDLTREDLLNGQVFIHGKESEPRVVQIGPRFFVSCGKLTGAAEQTCGLLDMADKQLRFSAFTLDGRVLVDSKVLPLGAKTKISVK
jgi:hypothetical protein